MNALFFAPLFWPVPFVSLCTAVGLVIGSFLNVVAYRLPIMWSRSGVSNSEKFNLAWPPSRCPNCGHRITALENIPVVSYLVLRGRCAGCRSAISVRYPLVELSVGVLTGLSGWWFGPTWQAAGAILLVWYLSAVFLLDVDSGHVPDRLLVALTLAGVAAGFAPVFATEMEAVAGVVVGYVTTWAARWVVGRCGGTPPQWHLLPVAGAWLGVGQLPVILVLGGMGVGLWRAIASLREQAPPQHGYGVAMAVAVVLAVFLTGPRPF